MKRWRATVFASVVFLVTPAFAEFTGIVCRPFVGEGWVEHGYTGLTTYRLYALFDDQGPEGDGVLSVYGLDGVPLSVQSSDGAFHNDARHDSLVEPEDLRPQGIWSNQWDTYVTIGVWYGAPGADTGVSPNFGNETNNLQSDWVTEFGGWFVTPCDFGSGCPGEAIGASEILLAQFTLAQGESVSGIVNLLRRSNGEEINGLLFSSDPPCAADIDGSGTVGINDLLRVLAAWGPCGGCAEDVDGDGVVGFADLVLVLAAWGACP